MTNLHPDELRHGRPARHSAAATPRVFITDTGVVVVDTKLAGWGQAMLDKIKTVTNKPVTTIINTHTHGDHTGSNEFSGDRRDRRAREHQGEHGEDGRLQGREGEVPAEADLQGQDVAAQRQGPRSTSTTSAPGHTNGDTFVVFPALRVLHAGDMFPWKDAPFFDRSNGGSGMAYPKTLAKALAASRTSTPSSPATVRS